MASPVKLAPAMGVVWVNAWVSGVPFHAEIVPFRLAKMNAAGAPFPPLAFETLKPIPIALSTCPVGPVPAPPGGMLTVKFSETVLPTTEGRMDVLVPWSEIQMGLPFANETPQGFTRLESVVAASPWMFETRLFCWNCAWAVPAPAHNAPRPTALNR